MYDDLLGPRKKPEEEISLKKKYKLNDPPPTSPPPTTNDPWAGAGEDLKNEEEEIDLPEFDLEFDEEELEKELEKALEGFADDDDCECEPDVCDGCDGCDQDSQLDPSEDIG